MLKNLGFSLLNSTLTARYGSVMKCGRVTGAKGNGNKAQERGQN